MQRSVKADLCQNLLVCQRWFMLAVAELVGSREKVLDFSLDYIQDYRI